MTINKKAESNYDFEVKRLFCEDLRDLYLFTSEVHLLKCVQGEAMISRNASRHHFKTNTHFILFDAVNFHVMECSDDIEVISCKFSWQFFNEIYSHLNNDIVNVLWRNTPDLYSKEEAEAVNLTFEKLCLLYKNNDQVYRHKIAINLVLCYVYEMYEMTYRNLDNQVVNTSKHVNNLLDRFYTLCQANHTRHRQIEFYTKELSISNRYLHKIMKDFLQITPKQVIDYYISGTAKTLLLSTHYTNQQIADKLNFPDQATFSQFFKRNVGISPSEFCKKFK